jgi:hypothetical protein
LSRKVFREEALIRRSACAVALVIFTLSGVCRAEKPSDIPVSADTPVSSDTPVSADTGRYVIKLINVDPGGELFMAFGHIAVIVEDKHTGAEDVYNFGTFDFDDPGLRFRYARGYLNYWLSVVPLPLMLHFYHSLGRGVTIRTLNFTPKQAEEVARRLEINARPENATYAYRHYIDNCCTRIRDLLDDMLNGAISEKYNQAPTGRSYRYWTIHQLIGMPVMRTIILLILGGDIDKPVTRWNEEFLPEVLAEDLDSLTVGPNHIPVIRNKERLFQSEKPNDALSADEIIPFVVLFSLLIIGFGLPLALPKKKWTARFAGLGLVVWGLLAGLFGVLLIFFWTYTVHYDTHRNENLLTFLALHLWLVVPGVKLIVKGRLKDKTKRFLVRYFIFALGLIALDLILKIGPFIQHNYQFIAFAAACNLAALFAVKRMD